MQRLLTTVLLPLLASIIPIYSQTITGSISGTVLDPSDAAVVNAKVTAVEQERKVTTQTVTDATGRFVFPQMPPGTYAVSVEAPGFKKFEQVNIVLNGNEKLALNNFALQVGSIDQSVEVRADALQLQTESGERSETMNTKVLENIAINGRSYLPLVSLIPGVTTSPNLQTAGHAGVGAISANGGRQNQNNLTLDGVGDVDTGNNGDQLATVSLDSVQEFRVLTNNYQAEYGRSSSAQISVVTKSGTSDFHGSAYWFHRHEGLNANNWKSNRDGQSRREQRYNDLGYTIGGPVFIPNHFNRQKNKLFFFFSQEYQRQLNPQGTRNQTVPTELERQGDFSASVDKNGIPVTIKDPTTGSPFPGNIIPTSRLYGAGLAVLALYPKPNFVLGPNGLPNKGFNYTSQISDSYPRREDLLRGDYSLSDKWKLFSRWINNSDAVTSYYGSFVLGSSIPLVPITDSRPGQGLVVSTTTLISPTMTNEATWGFGKNTIDITPTTNGLSRAATGIDLPVLYAGAVQQDLIPTFAFNGSRLANTASFGTNDAPFHNYNTTLEWIDNISKVWNQHTLKAGLYIQRSRKDQTSFANANGSYDFSDDASNPLDTGFGFANAALGVYRNFTQASKYATGQYRYTNIEVYLQDTWKVSRRLTLDYGLRVYLVQPQFDSSLQTSNFFSDRYNPADATHLYRPTLGPDGKMVIAIDPVTGQTAPGTSVGKLVPNSGNLLNGIALAGKDVTKYLQEYRGPQWGPRLGFAWDATGKQTIVVRGGGGIFYDRSQGNNVFDELTNPPTTFAPTLVNGFASQINPSNLLLAPSSLSGLDFRGKVPTTYNFSFGIQYKLPFQFVLDTAYVGSLSRHQLDKENINAIPYGATFLPQNQDPTKVAANSNATLGSNAYDRDFLRPFPGYGDISIHRYGSSSNYNSLQVGLNRRFSHGFQFGLAYTWGKALGVTGADGDFVRIDNLTRFANYGPIAAIDRRQTFAANYIYDLPAIFGKHKIAHSLLDGWQISGLTRFQSGAPYSVGFSVPNIGNQQLTGSYTEGARIQIVGDPLANTSGDPYNRINAAAFAPPQPGNIGLGAGVNYLTGPGINNTDLSVQKTFQITERKSLQLRGDAFNVFNHTQFSGYNTTVNFSGLTNPTVTNLFLKPNGTINDLNGFGTVSGARDPRIMQLVMRFVF
jgi:hypothetical protein